MHILARLAFALALTISVLAAGCEPTDSGNVGSTAAPAVSTAVAPSAGYPSSTHAVSPAVPIELRLAGALGKIGITLADMQVSTEPAESPHADVALEWEGGSAEVDTTGGRVYLFSHERPEGPGSAPLLDDEELEAKVWEYLYAFGWDDTLLGVLYFDRLTSPPAGSVSESTGLYTWDWHESAFDTDPTEKGLIEIQLDARTGDLARFSVSPDTADWLDLSGVISGDRAVKIARGELGMRGDRAGSVGATLMMVGDPAITGGQALLTWYIQLEGTDPDDPFIAGDVYLDAQTGAVLKSQPR